MVIVTVTYAVKPFADDDGRVSAMFKEGSCILAARLLAWWVLAPESFPCVPQDLV